MSIFKGLGWLFRSLWRLLNFTRLMLVNLLFLIVVLVIAFSLNQSETPSTPIEGALTLTLAGVLVEQRTQTDPTVQLLRQMEKSDDQPSEIVLSDLLWAIKSAGEDDRIKALVIKPQGLQGANFSKLQEVASAIDSQGRVLMAGSTPRNGKTSGVAARLTGDVIFRDGFE